MNVLGRFSQTPIVSERTPNKITLYFHQKQAPPTLPHELTGHVSPDTWASRVPQILRLTARHNHPRFEIFWMIAYFVLAIVIPATLHNVVANAANRGRPPQERNFFAAHLVSTSLFLAVTLAFWAPLLAWKYVGQQRARVLARRWVGEDSRAAGAKYSGYVPLWQIRLPGVHTNSTRVIINLPAYTSPTAYHPQAYLPSWIAGPAQPPLDKPGARDLDALPLYDGAHRPLHVSDEKAPVYERGGFDFAADMKV